MTSDLTRRRFLTLGAAVSAAAALPPLTAAALLRPGRDASRDPVERLATASQGAGLAPHTGSILVAIHLEGGNDGLHTVVPYSNDGYRELRGAHALVADDLHLLDDDYGLHAMPAMAAEWHEGRLAIIHGVGYDPPNLSHFSSADIWERGSLDPGEDSGWLGRALARHDGAPQNPFVSIATGESSAALRSPGVSALSVGVGETLAWSPEDRIETAALLGPFEQLNAAADDDSALAALVRAGHRDALLVGERIGPTSDAALDPSDEDHEHDDVSPYAEELHQQLSLVADLINADLPTVAYTVQQSGYDTHGEQAEAHPWLLGGLDRALADFSSRLGTNAERVTVMVWSEFGRRPYFNGSGTDHGTSSVALVLGDQIRGGHHGEQPPLRRFDRDNNFVSTVDFRALLGGVASSVLGVPPDTVSADVAPLRL